MHGNFKRVEFNVTTVNAHGAVSSFFKYWDEN